MEIKPSKIKIKALSFEKLSTKNIFSAFITKCVKSTSETSNNCKIKPIRVCFWLKADRIVRKLLYYVFKIFMGLRYFLCIIKTLIHPRNKWTILFVLRNASKTSSNSYSPFMFCANQNLHLKARLKMHQHQSMNAAQPANGRCTLGRDAYGLQAISCAHYRVNYASGKVDRFRHVWQLPRLV